MADDPYSVLSVSRTSSDEEIRRAYRRLAKEMHPDLNPDNRKVSEERFKRISAAYELLSDPEKRRKFDAGEIDANGEPRRQAYRPQARAQRGGSSPADDFGFTDIFSDIFGGRAGGGGAAAVRGQDHRYTLEVEFLESVNGARKRVTMPTGGTLDLSVPEGVNDGQVLRLKGKGSPGFRGGEAGDALVEIKVRPHRQFRREGNDILLDLPIAVDEAILGAKIEVQTVSGRVQLTIPKGTSSGRVFRLKGKGVKTAGASAPGDQLVTVRIVLPDTIDDQLSYFISEWRQKHQYNPGRE